MKLSLHRIALVASVVVGCTTRGTGAPAAGDSGAPSPGQPPPADAAVIPSYDAGTSVWRALCAPDQLCLRIQPNAAGAVPFARLVVAWMPLSDEPDAPTPEIAYDAPFDQTQEAAIIALGDIMAPPDASMLCERSCAVPTNCACTGDFAVAVGFVGVFQDSARQGHATAADVSAERQPVGMANVIVGFSMRGTEHAPVPFDRLFPGGVQAGMVPYRIVPGSPFDHVEMAPAGSIFDLPVCVGDAACDLPLPNLT